MRILIINDFFTQGGAETQAKDEIKTLNSHNIETKLLTFDNKYQTGYVDNNCFNYKRSNSLVGKFYNKFFLNISAYHKLKRIIKEFNPDFIHLHNTLKMTKTVNKLLKKFNVRIIKTFHDYGYICPKGTSVKDNGVECKGFKNANCKDCAINTLKRIVKLHELNKNYNWINKNVEFGFSPSINLKDKMLENGYSIKLNAFPNVYFGNLNKYEEKTNHDFLYCGVISYNKGINLLLDCFIIHPNYQLTIVGGIDNEYEEYFNNKIHGISNIKYLGKVPHDEIIKLYKSHYCLIVPSLWLENYPNVVLESLFAGTICIGANRGGIPEMLGNNKLLFNPLSIEALNDSIQYVLNIPNVEYKNIVEEAQNRLYSYNSEENFYEKFRSIINNEKANN